jgi:ABC-type transport system substrate-binding protein
MELLDPTMRPHDTTLAVGKNVFFPATLLESMNMSMKLIKLSVTTMVLGLCVGCGKTNAPDAASAPPAPSEVSAPAAPAPAVAPVAVALAEYDASTLVPAGGHCELDAINGIPKAGATVKAGTEAMFGGWIGDDANQVPSVARLVFKGADKAYTAPLVAGVERQDVAKALGAESMKQAGYNVLVKLDVAPGTYELSIVHGADAAAASCALGSVVVTN